MKKILEIPYDAIGTLIERPNRFLAIVDIENVGIQKVHVHDPGRLKEILYKGNQLLLRHVNKQNRKTQWDLIAGNVDNKWILIHSGYHRQIAEILIEKFKIFGDYDNLQAEVKYGHSRIDFVLEKKGNKRWIEVKGCTLSINNVALFPDAPTQRGTKHLQTLIELANKGEQADILILVFRPDSKCFLPNKDTDKKFTDTFYQALENNVNVHPIMLRYKDGTVYFEKEIPLCKD